MLNEVKFMHHDFKGKFYAFVFPLSIKTSVQESLQKMQTLFCKLCTTCRKSNLIYQQSKNYAYIFYIIW